MEPLDELAARVGEGLRGPPPHLVGVAGPVAVGKSTVAAELAARLDGVVLSTDAFLLPNRTLEERGLAYRKGFPESFDGEALVRALRGLREGRFPVAVPVYSHAAYDVLPGAFDHIGSTSLMVVEGVNALQDPAYELLHAGVYVHAPEEVVRRWYVERFLSLASEARGDVASFYGVFAAMSPAEVRAIAEATWDGINAPNLREHIGPTVRRATWVVEKGPHHEVLAVR